MTQNMYSKQFSTSNNEDERYYDGLEQYFKRSIGTDVEKLRNFAKFVPRPALSTFLLKAELFQKILNVQGSIIECGVFIGGGLMTWAQLSAIYEPVNFTRRIIGFDTFSGNPSVSEKDTPNSTTVGDVCADSYDDLQECIRLYDINRHLNHIPKVELVKGDATKTIPEYSEENPQLVVSMLYLDFNLYEPTYEALRTFVPHMPKGAMVVFDNLDNKSWIGATTSLDNVLGIRNLRIQRSYIQPRISYTVLD